ncbi:unnamed protein product, partial [Mesorhabditis spiculigera]
MVKEPEPIRRISPPDDDGESGESSGGDDDADDQPFKLKKFRSADFEDSSIDFVDSEPEPSSAVGSDGYEQGSEADSDLGGDSRAEDTDDEEMQPDVKNDMKEERKENGNGWRPGRSLRSADHQKPSIAASAGLEEEAEDDDDEEEEEEDVDEEEDGPELVEDDEEEEADEPEAEDLEEEEEEEQPEASGSSTSDSDGSESEASVEPDEDEPQPGSSKAPQVAPLKNGPLPNGPGRPENGTRIRINGTATNSHPKLRPDERTPEKLREELRRKLLKLMRLHKQKRKAAIEKAARDASQRSYRAALPLRVQRLKRALDISRFVAQMEKLLAKPIKIPGLYSSVKNRFGRPLSLFSIKNVWPSLQERLHHASRLYNFSQPRSREWLHELLVDDSDSEYEADHFQFNEEDIRTLLKIHRRRRAIQKSYHLDAAGNTCMYYGAGLVSLNDQFMDGNGLMRHSVYR